MALLNNRKVYYSRSSSYKKNTDMGKSYWTFAQNTLWKPLTGRLSALSNFLVNISAPTFGSKQIMTMEVKI